MAAGPIGAGVALTGLLLYSGKKGSLFWMVGPLAFIAAFFFIAPIRPAQHNPELYGIGGDIIAISFLGILWCWSKIDTTYEGVVKTGKHFQFIGYFFLYIAACFLCGHISGPHLKAFGNQPVNSPESMLVGLAVGWLFLFIGHYMATRVKS